MVSNKDCTTLSLPTDKRRDDIIKLRQTEISRSENARYRWGVLNLSDFRELRLWTLFKQKLLANKKNLNPIGPMFFNII